MESNEYLEEGFNPSKLKMVDLRKLLLKHGVDFDMSAKKTKLVNLFNEHIGSQREQLMHEVETIVPSSVGIIDVSDSSSTTHSPTSRTRSRTKRSLSPEEEQTATRKRTASNSKKNAKKARQSSKSKSIENAHESSSADESGQSTAGPMVEQEKIEEIEAPSALSGTKSTPKRRLPKKEKIVEELSDEDTVAEKHTKKGSPLKVTLSHALERSQRDGSPSRVKFEDMLNEEERAAAAATRMRRQESSKPGTPLKSSLKGSGGASTTGTLSLIQTPQKVSKTPSGSARKENNRSLSPRLATPTFKIRRESPEHPVATSQESAAGPDASSHHSSPFSDNNVFQRKRRNFTFDESPHKKHKTESGDVRTEDHSRGQLEKQVPDIDMEGTVREADAVTSDMLQYVVFDGEKTAESTPSVESSTAHGVTDNETQTPRSPHRKRVFGLGSTPERGEPESPAPSSSNRKRGSTDSRQSNQYQSYMIDPNELRISESFRQQLQSAPSSTNVFDSDDVLKAARAGLDDGDGDDVFTSREYMVSAADPSPEEVERDLAKAEHHLHEVFLETERRSKEHQSRRSFKAYLTQSWKDWVLITRIVSQGIAIFVMISYLLWFRTQKQALGYCETSYSGPFKREPLDLASDANVSTKFWHTVSPECIECPPHAVCEPDMHLWCVDGYVLRRHPFSLGGLLPISPRCLPDTQRQQEIREVKAVLLDELRKRHAINECGYLSSVDLEEVAAQVTSGDGMDDSDMNEFLMKIKSEDTDMAKLKDLLSAAIPEIEAESDIIVR